MKRCSTCGRELPLGEFYNNRSNPDGKDYQCKRCHNRSARPASLRWQRSKEGKAKQHEMYINRLIREEVGGIP